MPRISAGLFEDYSSVPTQLSSWGDYLHVNGSNVNRRSLQAPCCPLQKCSPLEHAASGELPDHPRCWPDAQVRGSLAPGLRLPLVTRIEIFSTIGVTPRTVRLWGGEVHPAS